jgi:integrase
MSKKNLSLKKVFSEFVERKVSRSDREDTIRTIKSTKALFFKFLLVDMTPKSFSRTNAIEFLNWYEQTGVSAVSRNNRLAQMRGIFADMFEAEVIKFNPFFGIRKLKESPTVKRCLTSEERETISKYLYENHYWLFIAFLLEYYCFIRPKELRYLKFSDFDLIQGTVKIRGEVSKNHKNKTMWVTIPETAMPFFRDLRFTGNNINHFVFGQYFMPHATIKVSPNAMRQAFAAAWKKLQEMGLIGNMDGITWYRVKDTGITDMANDKEVSIFETSKQARHKSTEMTMKYYHPEKVNKSIKKYGKKIF